MAKAPSKAALRKYERSSADKREDAKNAKRAGVSVKAWEGSKADMKADKAGARKMMKRGK